MRGIYRGFAQGYHRERHFNKLRICKQLINNLNIILFDRQKGVRFFKNPDCLDRHIFKIFIRREADWHYYSQGTVMSRHATYEWYECRYVEIPGRPVSIYNDDGSQAIDRVALTSGWPDYSLPPWEFRRDSQNFPKALISFFDYEYSVIVKNDSLSAISSRGCLS